MPPASPVPVPPAAEPEYATRYLDALMRRLRAGTSDYHAANDLHAECHRTIGALRGEAARLRAENARLREALEDLLSEQNDAPLERRREQWQSAVDAGWAALKS